MIWIALDWLLCLVLEVIALVGTRPRGIVLYMSVDDVRTVVWYRTPEGVQHKALYG